jgi:CheY-like chemotaxis protein
LAAPLEATDGSEAVRIYGENSAKIVAVTLDLMMPNTDGRETLAMLSAFAPDVAIIVSTALPQPENLLGRLPGERGMGCLQKPYTALELGAELRRVIGEIGSAS